MINQYKSHGKLGVIVSGEPNIVKTTTVSRIARRFERRRRDIGRTSGGNSIPVIYVSVPPPCTPKLMLGEFAHFLGLPVRAHYKTGELMNTVASVIAACGTELITVDEIHNINRTYKQMGDASDTLKQLAEKCQGTFVYAGVDVEASGLLDGTRGRQISSRFDILNLHKFENTGRGKAGWADLLVAVENSLGLRCVCCIRRSISAEGRFAVRDRLTARFERTRPLGDRLWTCARRDGSRRSGNYGPYNSSTLRCQFDAMREPSMPKRSQWPEEMMTGSAVGIRTRSAESSSTNHTS